MNQPFPKYPSLSDDLAWLAFRYVCDELTDEDRDTFEQRLMNDQAAREAVAAAVELMQAARYALGNVHGNVHGDVYGDVLGDVLGDVRGNILGDGCTAYPVTRSRSQAAGGSRRMHRVGWMVAGAAACLLTVVGLQQAGWLIAPQPLGRDHVIAIHEDLDAHTFSAIGSGEGDLGSALAMAWTQTRHMFSLADSERDVPVGALADGSQGSDDADTDHLVRELTGPMNSDDVNVSDALAVEEVESPSWMLAALAGMEQQSGHDAAQDDAAPSEAPPDLAPERQEG